MKKRFDVSYRKYLIESCEKLVWTSETKWGVDRGRLKASGWLKERKISLDGCRLFSFAGGLDRGGDF